jgi:lipoprotein NlpD
MAVLLALLTGCADRPRPAPIVERGMRLGVPAGPASAPGVYRVQAGDTLFKIAFGYDLDYRELARLNNLNPPYRIYSGQRLRVPARRSSATTTALAAMPAAEPARSLPAVPSADPPEAPAALTPTAWFWPVQGKVITEFDPVNGRKGLDIAGRRDTPVMAAASGTVVYAGSALRGYGKLVIVQHGPAWLSAYAHQSTLRVAEGQKVSAGEAIGAMGDSDTDRVKLHFEVREFGKPVDPRLFLPR